MINVLFVQFLFGIAFIFFKKTLSFGEPFFLVALRLLLAGILLLGYHFLFENRIKISKKFWGLILIASFFNIYVTNAFEFWGLQYVTAAKANFIYNLAPFLAAFLGYFLLNEVMTTKRWLGIIIGFVGFLPILIGQSPEEANISHVGWLSSAELAIILAAVGSSVGWTYVKKTLQTQTCSVFFLNGITFLIGGLFTLANSFFVETWNPIPINNFYEASIYTLLGLIVSSLMAYNLYTFLLRGYSATFLSLTSLISPLITAIFGFIFLKETITLTFVISFILVSIGLYIFYLQEKKVNI